MQSETIAYYEEYRYLSQFANIDELNEAVRNHLHINAATLNKTEVAVFKLLSRYSCVVKGVSWMKRATIAAHIEKSEKTVSRALKTLEDCGIIKRVPTIRKKGGRGYDLCVIQKRPVEMSSRELAKSPCGSSVKEGSSREETIHKNKDYVIEPGLNDLDSSFTPDNIPPDFVRAAKPFFNAAEIHTLWDRVKKAHNSVGGLDAKLSELTKEAVHALKTSVFAYKRGMIRKSFRGYFYKAVRASFVRVFYAELQEMIA
ncbi:helix-turn-helix domain-containing protein [Evansella clarkii]|uniref:helix-turn-helix domain-containing protein n=1 Tax=Evansella clarkii TaxID=79879 RepID=UPI000B434B24|nr:helix-turn-helix domain-containing protein [Evansella clarkii]